MKIQRGISAGVAFVGALAFAGTAQAILNIDTFNTGSTALVANSGTPVSNQVLPGQPVLDVIGGVRETTVNYQAGPLSVRADINPPFGTLGLSSDTDTTGLFELTYDAGGAGLGGIDVTEGGTSTGFVVFFIAADAGAATTVTLTDTGGDTLTRTLLTGGPGFLFFNYATFAGIGDVTDVNRIDFQIQGQVDGDYQIDLIQSRQPPNDVPEPITATLSLLGLGVLGMATRRRA